MTTGTPVPRWHDEIRDPASVRILAERYWSAITPADAAAEREFEAAFPVVRQRGELDKSLFVQLARWKSKRITPVLRRAGFEVGDRPWLRMTGRHSFVLQHANP